MDQNTCLIANVLSCAATNRFHLIRERRTYAQLLIFRVFIHCSNAGCLVSLFLLQRLKSFTVGNMKCKISSSRTVFVALKNVTAFDHYEFVLEICSELENKNSTSIAVRMFTFWALLFQRDILMRNHLPQKVNSESLMVKCMLCSSSHIVYF